MGQIGLILVISNHLQIAAVIADVLCDVGYTVRIAGNREDVLAALARDPLALVLLDAFMPELTGMDLYQGADRTVIRIGS